MACSDKIVDFVKYKDDIMIFRMLCQRMSKVWRRSGLVSATGQDSVVHTIAFELTSRQLLECIVVFQKKIRYVTFSQ